MVIEALADQNWYSQFLTPAEFSFLKVAGFMVAFIWALVELRTRNKFSEIVSFSRAANLLAEAANIAVNKVTVEIQKLNESLKNFAGELKHTAETDSASTKLINERIERQALLLKEHDNRLSTADNLHLRLTTRVRMLSDQNNIKDEL
jgi:hypothetical protein